MVSKQMIDEEPQLVSLGNVNTKLFQKRFEVFFGALLAMKTNTLMQRLFAPRDSFGDGAVVFRFSHPFRR
jgi:hypothetical protein